MLSSEQEAKIRLIYDEYLQEIKPLGALVERAYFKFPKGFLKEFRDVFDHIARCYSPTCEDVDEEIRKARNHFDRIKLDAYKYLSDFRRREYVRWKRKYSKYDVQSIHDGTFWSSILNFENNGELFFYEARKQEGLDTLQACSLYQESTLQYDEIQKLIDENSSYLNNVKFRYIRGSLFTMIISFVTGVAASIIASIILSYMPH